MSFYDNWHEVLHQNRYWVDFKGERKEISSMLPVHCGNAADFILKNVSRLAEADLTQMLTGPQPSGDAANDAFDGEILRLEHIVANSRAWAEETPLVIALRMRSEGRKPPAEVEDSGNGTYVRTPHKVLAVRYTGTNAEEVASLVQSADPWVESEVSTITDSSGGERLVLMISQAREVYLLTVGDWMVIDESTWVYSVVTDANFRKSYAGKVKA